MTQVSPAPEPAMRPNPVALPRRSAALYRWFTWWVRGYLARHFHAVRLARGTRPQVEPDTPLVVVLNHPSWWDPLVGSVLAGLFPGHTHYAPIDAAALARYGLFARLGFYGVEAGTLAGAADFLQTTTAILSRPRTAVWLTAQGRFADPRERPADLRAGIGHLARRLPHGLIVPLALEYPFWNERLPEALARFGEPLSVESGSGWTARQWTAEVEDRLAATQDELATAARARDPGGFDTLVSGRAGVGGVYDRWRRLRACARGERFRPEHDPRPDRP
jgi:1-acyl-sn-glycerol-3-phosphate acyltransferase